jgi:hypothetical protein
MSHEISYYGFDLDDTIGYIHQFFPIIAVLKPSVYNIHVSDELSKNLEKIYNNFVFLLAEREKQTPHILNPYILNILRSSKKGYSMMYSNNSVLELLHFASDLIETVLGKKIFCAHVHLYHPIRNQHTSSDYNVPKTWNIYKKIFTELCSAPEPTPEQSVFFDDIEHPDLMKMLGNNYFHIHPYHKKYNYNQEYKTFIKYNGLVYNHEFYNYLLNLLSKIDDSNIKKKIIQLHTSYGFFKHKIRKTLKKRKYTRKIKNKKIL